MRATFKRPRYISFLSGLGIIWSLLSFLYVFSPAVKKVGAWFPALLGMLIAFRFISMIGVWHMKKWGVALFILSLFLKLFISVILDQLSAVEVVLSVWLGVSFLFFFGKMDDNL
jgi:hypothetical protein